MSYKPRLTFWQIINMNVGFFGIQYSFGLQQTAINPLYTFLHANPEQLPLLNLAGPDDRLIDSANYWRTQRQHMEPTLGQAKTVLPGWSNFL